jgi:putative endonuclease
LKQGQRAERKARDFLIRNGLRHIDSNYRCPCGELDLVMEDGEHVVFVEVRYRNSDRFGGALASIDFQKQKKLRTSAEYYRQRHKPISNRPCRFDVISFTGNINYADPEWIKDAF